MSDGNNASSNGHEAPVGKIYKLELEWNPSTGDVKLTGISNGAVVNLGMLEWGVMVVKRFDANVQLKTSEGRGRLLVIPQ